MFEFVDASPQFLDVENRLDGGESGVELGEVCRNVGMHESQGYRHANPRPTAPEYRQAQSAVPVVSLTR